MLLAALTVGLALMADTTQTAPAAPPPTSTTAKVDKKPVLKCEKMAVLGSRMPVRVCRSPEQIAQSQRDAKDMTVEFQKINPEQISK